MNDGLGISISSGTAAILSVNGNSEKTVGLKISTTTSPRGRVKEEIEKELDNKYEALLKVDENETAHNIMLVDAARNDITRISESRTAYVDKMLIVNKQDEFQSLTSNVKGTLNQNLDALHAYMAVINPAVTNGIPKAKCVQLLGKTEKGKKGFCSGSVFYVSPDKELYGMTVKPVRIKKGSAYFRTSARVFHNSDDNNEFKASDKKAAKLLDALKSGGIK
jgi:anthranilate synthase component 1